LSILLKSAAASVREQIVSAARSLASFLVAIKQLEPPAASELLSGSALLSELPQEDRTQLLNDLVENASFFFEHPDLDPDGDLADKYLDELAAINARTPPRAAAIEDTLDDVAAFLRRSPKKMQVVVEKHYAAALFKRLPADAPQRRIPAAAARAALDLLADEMEPARFLYGPARLQWPDAIRPKENDGDSLWLLGVGQRMILFATGDQPRVVWRGEPGNVRADAARQLLATNCRLTGGQWQLPAGSVQPQAFRLSGGLVANYGQFFRPLLSMLGLKSGAADAPAVAAP
jgi:hypothetical protein